MELTSYLLTLKFNILFYLLLLAGTFLFLIKQDRRPHFFLRLIPLVVAGYIVMGLLRLVIHNSNLNNLLTYSSALLMMAVVSYACFKISWGEAIFCMVAGYSAQFIQSMCSELLTRLFLLQGTPQVLCQIFSAVAIYPIVYHFFGKKLQKGQNFDLNKWALLILMIGAVLIEIVICHNLRQQWRIVSDPIYLICDCILLMLCSVTLMTVQFSLLLQRNLRDELRIIDQMRRKDQEQYQISSETIDLINRKCHDMRHQIRTIGRSAKVNPAALEEMGKAINVYDSIYNTGSHALDIILTEKSLYCQKYNIQISCVADGAALGFICDTDIYSLFGNLLENAINAVQDLEPDMRIIGLSVKCHGQLLSVNSHNCYAGNVIIRDGLPVTTNPDPMNHGFGTRSMMLIAEKYGGTVSFLAKEGIFNINMLFPINEPEA